MAKKTIKAQMKQRRDTKANWEATNPVLLDGELGIVSDDPNLYKVGDGATAWNDLPFRGFDGTLAQELGTSPNAVISQKVVSEKLTELESKNATMGVIELKLFQEGAIVANINVGEFAYNNNLKVLVEKTSEAGAYINRKPSENGLYIFKGEYYRWNGTDLVRWDSESVKNLESKIKEDVVLLPMKEIEVREGVYIDAAGNALSNSNLRTKIYSVKANAYKVKFNAPADSAFSVYAFYNSEIPQASSLIGRKGINDFASGDIISVPSGAKIVTITEHKTYASYYTTIEAAVKASSILAAPQKKMVASFVDGVLCVSFKHDTDNDFVYFFKNCLANKIFHPAQIAIYPNSLPTAILHSEKETASRILFNGGTDLIGPVNIEGIGFVGGNHLVGGNTTASTESVAISIDGNDIADGWVGYCDTIQVNVVNNIFNANSSKIREIVNYTIAKTTIDVDCSHEYLDNFTITNYYGPQSAFGGKVLTPKGQYTNFTTPSDGSFAWSAYPAFRHIINDNNGYYQSLYLNPKGIGLYPSGFIHSGTKDYFVLKGGAVKRGEHIHWSAQYHWFANCINSDSLFSFATDKLFVIAKGATSESVTLPAKLIGKTLQMQGDASKASLYESEIAINTTSADSFVVKEYSKDISAMFPTCRDSRVVDAIKKVRVLTLDNTREYALKSLSWDRYSEKFKLEITTLEADVIAYSLETSIPNRRTGLQYLEGNGIEVWVDLDSLYQNPANISVSTEELASYRVKIEPIGIPAIHADDYEMNLRYSSFRLMPHYYGKISKKFYLSTFYDYNGKFWVYVCTANAIIKEQNSRDNNLELVFDFDKYPQVKAVRAIRELNNGNLFLCTWSVSPAYGNVKGYYSEYYIYDVASKTLTKKFEGNWRRSDDGSYIVAGDAFMTDVWDFSEYNNTIVMSERVGQGVGGKIWYSKDGGNTWYLIFNAQPTSNDGAYPIRMPAWDNKFDEGIEGTPTYPKSNFHVHGVTYDHYRNQIIMVSGDATWVQDSYSAIWVLKNPDQCTLYPASSDGVIKEGGTNVDGIPKMLNCGWKRIGLHHLDAGNNVGHDLQFVNCVPFKNHLAFGSDCYPNGIYIMTNPSEPSLANIRLAYSLDIREEADLTHCASACFKESFSPYLWVFHRESASWNANTSINDRKAYILSSEDGLTWNRVWEDDTLNANRETKLSWGAKIIGHAGELLLRYQGFSLDKDCLVRHIRL